MKLIKSFLFALCFLTLSQSSFSQNTAALKTDSICKTIDTLSLTFKKIAIKGLGREKLNSIKLFYIDTLNHTFRKVLYQQMSDKIINTYYYKDQQLIKLELSKKVGTNVTNLCVYYFKNQQVIFKVDKQHLVKNLKTYLENAKEYLDDPVIIH
jgi:hypothetical protein